MNGCIYKCPICGDETVFPDFMTSPEEVGKTILMTCQFCDPQETWKPSQKET